jgi:hypothetical protein
MAYIPIRAVFTKLRLLRVVEYLCMAYALDCFTIKVLEAPAFGYSAFVWLM